MNILKKRTVYIFETVSRLPMVIAVIGYLIGVVASEQLSASLITILPVCVVLPFLRIQMNKKIVFIIFLTIGLAPAIGMSSDSGRKIDQFNNSDVEIFGEVLTHPYEKGSDLVFDFKPIIVKNFEHEYEIDHGIIRAKSWKYSEIEKGDFLTFESFLEEPENFEEFDYKKYLNNQKIFSTVSVPSFVKIDSSNKDILTRNTNKFRANVVNYFRSVLPEPHASLMLGMLIGTREEFSDEFNQSLSATGTTHIIAVSGFNVNIIIIIMLRLAGVLPRRIVYLASYIIVFIFILVVGTNNLPAVRAMIMGYSALVGNMFGRKSVVYSTVSFSVLVMMILNPLVIYSLSFQLSFASTLGLILIAKKLEGKLPKVIGSSIREELSVTLAASIATFPIIFSSFGKINPWASIANIMVAPVIPIIMLLGTIQYLVSLVLPGLAPVFNILSWFVLEYMVRMIMFVAKFPYAELIIGEHRKEVSIVFLILVLIYLFEVSYRKYVKKTDTCTDSYG